MTTPINSTLSDKAEAIEAKAEEERRALNIEQEVEVATNNLRSLNRGLKQLADELEELHFYTKVLTEVFGKSRPGIVDDAVDRVETVAEQRDETVLSAAEDKNLEEIEREFDKAGSVVDNAIKEVRSELQGIQDEWSSDVDSAEELYQIIGGGGEASKLFNNIDRFLSASIWDTSKHIQTLSAEWDRYTDDWESITVGWDEFQSKHGLSDETINSLKRFTDSGTKDVVLLSHFSLDVLEEIKSVPELESSLRVEIDS